MSPIRCGALIGVMLLAVPVEAKRKPKPAKAAQAPQLIDVASLNLPPGYRVVSGKGLCRDRPQASEVKLPATNDAPASQAVKEDPKPKRPAPPPVQKGSIAGEVKLVVRGAPQSDASHVVVALLGVPGGQAKAPSGKPHVIQRDLRFTPELNIVTVGTTVEFPNEDRVFHNIFSVSEASKFDLGLYKSGESKAVTFTKPGLVDVYCNIHPQMVAKIKVLDTRYYVETGKDGRFHFDGIPEGKYKVAIWHARSEEQRREIEVKRGEVTRIDPELELGAVELNHLRKDGTPYGRYK